MWKDGCVCGSVSIVRRFASPIVRLNTSLVLTHGPFYYRAATMCVCDADIVVWKPCVYVKRTRSTVPTRSARSPSSTTRNGRNARTRSSHSFVSWSRRRRKRKTEDDCELLLRRACTGWRKKTGPAYLIANILKTP